MLNLLNKNIDVPLPFVALDIVGQSYETRAKVKYKTRATSHSFNPFGWKISSSCC